MDRQELQQYLRMLREVLQQLLLLLLSCGGFRLLILFFVSNYISELGLTMLLIECVRGQALGVRQHSVELPARIAGKHHLPAG